MLNDRSGYAGYRRAVSRHSSGSPIAFATYRLRSRWEIQFAIPSRFSPQRLNPFAETLQTQRPQTAPQSDNSRQSCSAGQQPRQRHGHRHLPGQPQRRLQRFRSAFAHHHRDLITLADSVSDKMMRYPVMFAEKSPQVRVSSARQSRLRRIMPRMLGWAKEDQGDDCGSSSVSIML